MKPRLLLAALAVLAVGSAWAQATDPDAVLTQINTALRSTEGTPQERAAKARTLAEDAMKGFDVSKVEAAKAMSWAQIAMRVQKYQEVSSLVDKFLTTNPGEPLLSQAYSNGIVAAAYLDNPAKALELAGKWTPADDAGKLSRASMVFGWIGAEGVSKVKGAAEAEPYLRSLVSSLPAKFEDANLQQRLNSALAQGFEAIAEIHETAGSKDKALAALDEGLAKVTDDRFKRGLSAKKSQLSLIGSAAPGVTATHTIGSFTSLEALKGKIIVLDFFAHWCGPCRASFPDLRKMYADLKDKGVEIVHATTFYGYFGQERNLTKDQEFDKMKGFASENGLVWPVVFLDRKDFESYGVSGIPHIVLIDADGKVNRFKIGYSPETFATFRKQVEELVAASKTK